MCNAPIETQSLHGEKVPSRLGYAGWAQSCCLLPEPPRAQTSPENTKISGQGFVVGLKNVCSSQCLVSLGIWHRAVKPYVVHHLLQDLPGYRKLKVLEERLPSQSKCLRPGRSQRWGWACQAQTLDRGFVWLCYRSDAVVSGRGLWAGPPCSFLSRSGLSGACRNWDLKFQVRACLATRPTHGNGSEIPDTSSCLDFHWVLPHKVLWEKNLAPDLFAPYIFFSSQTSQTRSKPNTVWRSICELEQTWPSLQFLTKPQSSSASPGSRLGFAQLLGSKQPKPVGFNCYRRRSPCSGT